MNREEYKKLALKWAPINYQYVKLKDKIQNHGREDLAIETKRDLLVPINLDGFTNTCECGFMEHEHKQYIKMNEKQFLDKSDLEECTCSNFTSKYKNPEDAWDTHNRRKVLKKTLTQNLLPVAYYIFYLLHIIPLLPLQIIFSFYIHFIMLMTKNIQMIWKDVW